MIRFQKPETKQEALFQGFVLLFQSGKYPNLASVKEREELTLVIQSILQDPEITVEIAQACCDRAVNVLNLENQLHKKNTPKDHPCPLGVFNFHLSVNTKPHTYYSL